MPSSFLNNSYLLFGGSSFVASTASEYPLAESAQLSTSDFLVGIIPNPCHKGDFFPLSLLHIANAVLARMDRKRPRIFKNPWHKARLKLIVW